MRALLCLLATALLTQPAFAQEDESDSESTATLRPGSDSPEAAHPHRYDGPRHRAQAFLIPMDEGARAPTGRVAAALQQVLAHAPQYEVIDLGQALSVDATEEQSLRADEGRRILAEANQLYSTQAYAQAIERYHKALQSFERGLPAVGAMEYAQTVLRLGAAQWLNSEETAARNSFVLVAKMDPQRKVDTRQLGPSVEGAVQAAQSEINTEATGVLELETRPAAGRVQIDGENNGNAPVHIQLPAGKHFVRVERPGFYPHAQLVEVPAHKTASVTVSLAATPAATSINQSIAGAADEVGRGLAGKNVAALSTKFLLERMLVGSVRSQGMNVTVVLALVDASHRRVIGAKSLLLAADGTDADQIENDTQNAARTLIAMDKEDAADGASEAVAQKAAEPDAQPARHAVMPDAQPAERRAVMPGAQPTADDPGLVAREPRAEPRAETRAEPRADEKPAEAAADAPAPSSTEQVREEKKRKSDSRKAKGIKGKTGTEEWGDD